MFLAKIQTRACDQWGREGGKEAHLISVRGTQPAAARSGGQDFSAGCSLHRHRHSCKDCPISSVLMMSLQLSMQSESQLGNLAKASSLLRSSSSSSFPWDSPPWPPAFIHVHPQRITSKCFIRSVCHVSSYPLWFGPPGRL